MLLAFPYFFRVLVAVIVKRLPQACQLSPEGLELTKFAAIIRFHTKILSKCKRKKILASGVATYCENTGSEISQISILSRIIFDLSHVRCIVWRPKISGRHKVSLYSTVIPAEGETGFVASCGLSYLHAL
jgi:hypothetical protein